MTDKTFRALVVSETADKQFVREIKERRIDELPAGEVLIRVHYSSLNYKDVLSAIGNRGVTRHYPHTPGVDAAGVVEASDAAAFPTGQEVIVTSYDLGMNTSGGFGQYIRVPAAWIVKKPANLSLRESMIYGTAGFTAALSVLQLEQHGVTPERGPVLVSGATGGVGGLAVALLARAGYAVTAVNGSIDREAYLRQIGAREVIRIEDATDTSGKPLLKTRWAGVVDAVGGEILATAVKSTQSGGAVTCCGNVGSHDLPLNVYPFILRGVTLIGIDSQNCPMELRQKTWEKLGGDWKLENLEQFITEVPLEGLSEQIDAVLQRKRKGRTLVRLSD